MADEFANSYCERPDDAVVARAARIALLAVDVDGVLTDGTVFIGADGEAFKPFNTHDGKGLSLLRAEGVATAVITARQSSALHRRATELGLDHIHQGVGNKAERIVRLSEETGIPLDAIAFMGDDLVDLGAAARVGLAVAVADAHPLLAGRCHWQTRRPGGRGAVRETCELILAARGRLQAHFQRHA